MEISVVGNRAAEVLGGDGSAKMRWILPSAAWLLATAGAAGQALTTMQCAQDPQGNQVCAGTQPDQNFCGCLDMFGDCRAFPVYCRNVVVEKTAPNGQVLYTSVLGGESDQAPYRFHFDALGNVVLLGTTYSRQFPVTPDAFQPAYAGPPPAYSTSGTPLPPGGDIFLSILGPTGQVLYSTFLGSSGSDSLLGVDAPEYGLIGRRTRSAEVDALVRAGAGDFPLVPANSPVLPNKLALVTFDLARRKLSRSIYLPVGPAYSTAGMADDGTISVNTADALYTFRRDGELESMLSLASFDFLFVSPYPDSAGNLWLVGENQAKQWIVAKLAGGTTEAFRWTLPAPAASSALAALFFGPDGLIYVGGSTSSQTLPTTPNAMLEAPCPGANSGPGLAVVFNSSGQVQMLSYLPGAVASFSANASGIVSAVMYGQTIPLDLSQRPKPACVEDAIGATNSQNRLSSTPSSFAVGQILQVFGGGFGPSAAVASMPGPGQLYPKSLGGVSIDVGGLAAPILSAAAGQATFAIPFATPGGSDVPVVVQYGGQQSAAFPIPVAPTAPWLDGWVSNPDGTANTVANPAAWGATMTVYLTGAGPYNPPLADGELAPNDFSHGLELPVSISFDIDGPPGLPGTIVYAGPAPGQIGVAQIRFQLPATGPPPSPGASVQLLQPQLTIGSASVYLYDISVK